MIVIKVGGSLLDWPGLPDRLAREIADCDGQSLILICGGGRFADALRDLDQIHGLGESRSHSLALRVLDLTAQVLADLVPGSEVVSDLARVAFSQHARRVPILAPRRLLEQDDALPHAWSTTTDSIAARVAERVEADELRLLKSVQLPPSLSLEEAASLGYVDSAFPEAARRQPLIKFVNARDPGGLSRAFTREIAGRFSPR